MINTLKKSPTTCVLIGAFIISFSGVWVKLAQVPPTTSAFYRVFFGFLFLLLASMKSKTFDKPTKKSSLLIMLCGLFFAFDLILWHASIDFIGPGLATILGNFQVFIMAAIGIVFFKEVFKVKFIFAIPLAILGLFLVVGINWSELGQSYKTGVYYGLGTAVCYAGFLLILRNIQSDNRRVSFYNSLMFISLTCAIYLGILMWVSQISFVIPDTKSLFSLLCLGLFSQTIGWILIANAMPKIRASFTGLILLLQPTLAFVWDVLFFHRQTDLVNWVGVSITLCAIYLGITSNILKK